MIVFIAFPSAVLLNIFLREVTAPLPFLIVPVYPALPNKVLLLVTQEF